MAKNITDVRRRGTALGRAGLVLVLLVALAGFQSVLGQTSHRAPPRAPHAPNAALASALNSFPQLVATYPRTVPRAPLHPHRRAQPSKQSHHSGAPHSKHHVRKKHHRK